MTNTDFEKDADDRHSMAERLTDAEKALEEAQAENAALAERLYDAEQEAAALRAEDVRSTEYMREMLRKVDEEGGKIAICSWCALPTLSDAETKKAHQNACPENPMRRERDDARAALRALKKQVGDFTDWACGDARLITPTEVRKRAQVLVGAIRGGS